MRTYAVQFIQNYNTFVRGEILRLDENDAVFLVNNGYAVYCVI